MASSKQTFMAHAGAQEKERDILVELTVKWEPGLIIRTHICQPRIIISVNIITFSLMDPFLSSITKLLHPPASVINTNQNN